MIGTFEKRLIEMVGIVFSSNDMAGVEVERLKDVPRDLFTFALVGIEIIKGIDDTIEKMVVIFIPLIKG